MGQQGLPQEVRAVADVISARMGYEGTGIGTVTEQNFRVFPSLRYDGNINGGFENSSFDVGGLTFGVDPSSQSISGMLLGADFRTGLHASLLEGLALEARAEGSFEVSPEYHLTKSFLYTDLCLRHRASLSMYFHTCVDRMHRRFELGKSTQTGIRVGATRLLAFGGGFHELSTELCSDEHLREDISYTQTVASIGILSALRGPVALFVENRFYGGVLRAQLSGRAAEPPVLRCPCDLVPKARIRRRVRTSWGRSHRWLNANSPRCFCLSGPVTATPW